MKRSKASGHRPCRSACLGLLAVVLALENVSAQILPPPPARPGAGGSLSDAPKMTVREFRFEGNTVFTDAELAKLTAPYSNGQLNSEDLEQARRAVTLHYIEKGYVNSGAVIPDQNPQDGVVLIRIVEGALTRTELRGNRWLRDGYVERRLRRWSARPLNLQKLQEGLQLLRQNPNVRQINAELKPGLAPGQSTLHLRVEDLQPFRLGLQIDNQRPPSVGSEELWLLASDLNLTGNSDPLDIRYGLLNSKTSGFELSGANNLEGSYSLPLGVRGTALALRAGRVNTRLEEETFVPLDVKSLTTSHGISFRQSVYQTTRQEAEFSVGFDHRKNRTSLLGQPFNLSPGAENGRTTVSALRISQDWIDRGQSHVLAFRSTFSFGLGAFGSTDNGIAGDPDGRFFQWLGQGHYVQRLFNTQNELVLRLTGQWTSEPLLALEQFSVGGLDTVRGYFENQLVRDRGFVSSVEFHVPVLYNRTGAGILHLAPFFDVGGGWNVKDSPNPTTIASTGIGVLFFPSKRASVQFYWGYRLQHIDTPKDSGAQGMGIGFKINVNAF